MKTKKWILIYSILLVLVVPILLMGYVYLDVTEDAKERLKRGIIDKIIASESPVFYSDGNTPIGVFFEKTHRKYINYEDIPKIFIKALIASEDQNFFDHCGFDIKAILRSLIANIEAGKVVQGGSTITQQTAKNIFRRRERTYTAKLKELMQALLLESKYSKEEILEMYINQFFVTGYGKGLGIAAQYFFAKDPRELNLVEAAFIAGSVKAPNRYNPFLKKTEIEKEKAKRLAKQRKNHVLENMYEMNFISKEEFLDCRKEEVPFKEGKITYRLNVIMDYIREQLESDYFKEILSKQGVENIATSGIKIYTFIDKDIQQAAIRSLRTHLPLMEIKLNGYDPEKMDLRHEDILRDSVDVPLEDLPFQAKITQIEKDKGCIHVSWPKGSAIIDYEGIKSVGDAWLKWKNGIWADFNKAHMNEFLANFEVGDPVHLKIISPGESRERIEARLSLIPELEGGIVVLHNGMIKAMVGGFFNRFFNRAVHAKRQLGSIFKPIVYTAALQLKWNILDACKNRRRIFRFEGTSYVPRPDHEPKSNKVSLAWAGVKSENLATVWLLYHLTDHLSASEFEDVAEICGLTRKSVESYKEYKERIRDRHGVVVDREALMEAALSEAKNQVRSDIIFSGHEEMLKTLPRLHYDAESVNEAPEDGVLKEFSYKRLCETQRNMKAALEDVNQRLSKGTKDLSSGTEEDLWDSLRHFYRSPDGGSDLRIFYFKNRESVIDESYLKITPQWILARKRIIPVEEIWIEGLITSGILDLLQEEVEENYRRLSLNKPYSMKVLSGIRDFKTLVNLSYVVYLSEAIGIYTKLDKVLSFPLGPNSISILEAALAYQTMLSARKYPLAQKPELPNIPIISKITDREGEALWSYEPREQRVLSERVSGLIAEILKHVMENGTGSSAKGAVKLYETALPSFGKTGTANYFRNSSFVGLIPGPLNETGRLKVEEGYVIASYVGYDDNRPMKSKHVSIYGSTGALPLWIDTAKAIAQSDNFKENLQIADVVFDPLPERSIPGHEYFSPVCVSEVSGLPVEISAETGKSSACVRIFADVEKARDGWKLNRSFEPVRRNAWK